MVAKTVDSYRFLDGVTRRVMRHWAQLPGEAAIPWTPLSKPVSRCTVAIVSSAGLALKSDRPFDAEIEKQDPWTSDSSFRILPRTVRTGDVAVCHLHINPAFATEDLNTVLPVEWLQDFADSAPSHYSYMGYTLRPQRLLQESVPAMVSQLRAERVDAVLLVPV